MDNNNCIASSQENISQPQILNQSSVVTDVSCFGSCDGLISIIIIYFPIFIPLKRFSNLAT